MSPWLVKALFALFLVWKESWRASGSRSSLDMQPDVREASLVSAAAAMLSQARTEHKGEEERRKAREGDS